MNSIQMLNVWAYLSKLAEQEGKETWLWTDRDSGNISIFKLTPKEKSNYMIKDISVWIFARAMYPNKEIWYWIDRTGAYFSWLFRDIESNKTDRSWSKWNDT